jgi:hypothetical protein
MAIIKTRDYRRRVYDTIEEANGDGSDDYQ